MNKVFLVCGLGLFLAGCNATVYTPRPTVIDLETRSPLILPRSYEPPFPPPRPERCWAVGRSGHGYNERVICGNHIP